MGLSPRPRSPEAPPKVRPRSPEIRAAVGDALAGADAVISALGPDGNTADQVVALREGMRTVIATLRHTGVRRIMNLSGAAVDAPGDIKPVIDRVASRIVRLVSGHVVAAE